MTTLQIANEGTTEYLAVAFETKDGIAAVPVSVTYRIDCITSGQQIRDSTVASPLAASMEIKLTPSDNAIIAPGASTVFENRRVTVKAVLGDGDVVTDEYLYTVKSLPKLSEV
jgi:hypothetical protein